MTHSLSGCGASSLVRTFCRGSAQRCSDSQRWHLSPIQWQGLKPAVETQCFRPMPQHLRRRPHRVPPAGLTQGLASWFKLELSHRCFAMGLPWIEAEGLGLGAWSSVFGSVAATSQLTSLSLSFPICVMSWRDPLEILNQRTQHKLCMPSTQFCPFLPHCSHLEGGTLSTMPLATFLQC